MAPTPPYSSVRPRRTPPASAANTQGAAGSVGLGVGVGGSRTTGRATGGAGRVGVTTRGRTGSAGAAGGGGRALSRAGSGSGRDGGSGGDGAGGAGGAARARTGAGWTSAVTSASRRESAPSESRPPRVSGKVQLPNGRGWPLSRESTAVRPPAPRATRPSRMPFTSRARALRKSGAPRDDTSRQSTHSSVPQSASASCVGISRFASPRTGPIEMRGAARASPEARRQTRTPRSRRPVATMAPAVPRRLTLPRSGHLDLDSGAGHGVLGGQDPGDPLGGVPVAVGVPAHRHLGVMPRFEEQPDG